MNDQNESQSQPTVAQNNGIPSQSQRWTVYGLNVLVMILATLAIVVLVNYIANQKLYKRFDFTSTRKYSLSEQTTKLLADLRSKDKQIDITTLYAKGTREQEYMDRVRDLLREYDRRSPIVNETMTDPVADVAGFEQFTEGLLDRFDSQIGSVRKALESVDDMVSQINAFAAEQAPQFKEARSLAMTANDPQTHDLITQIHQVFSRMDAVLGDMSENIDQVISQPLPDFNSGRRGAEGQIKQVNEGVLNIAIEKFEALAKDESANADLRSFAESRLEPFKKLRDQINDFVDDLSSSESAEYDEVRNKLGDGNAVIVTTGDGPKDIAVLTLSDIYEQPQVQNPNEPRPEVRFKGEEAVTGAIVRLTLENKPKIVFINSTPAPAVGFRGQYAHIAERLRSMQFEVEEWNPTGRPGPQGQPMPPQPMPEAKEGQALVLVLLPSPPNMGQFGPRPGGGNTEGIAAVRKHLQEGKPAFVIAAPNPTAQFNPEDPLKSLLGDWGITADSGKLVFNEIVVQDNFKIASNQIDLDEWPSDHAIGKALSGLRGVSVQGVPLTLADDKKDGIEYWPLAMTPDETWADSELFNPQQASRDAGDPAGPFTISYAVEKTEGEGEGASKTRLIVLGDQAWGTDGITTHGPRIFGQTLYIAFPANSEMFVNGIYWLAGLDQLIATSARTQDVRRIEGMSKGSLTAVRFSLLVIMPLLCLGIGVGVWVIRRK